MAVDLGGGVLFELGLSLNIVYATIQLCKAGEAL